jgi:hypothetical protein
MKRDRQAGGCQPGYAECVEARSTGTGGGEKERVMTKCSDSFDPMRMRICKE